MRPHAWLRYIVFPKLLASAQARPKLPSPPNHYVHASRLSLMLLVVWVDSLVSASQDSAAQVAHREVERKLDRRKELGKE